MTNPFTLLFLVLRCLLTHGQKHQVVIDQRFYNCPFISLLVNDHALKCHDHQRIDFTRFE